MISNTPRGSSPCARNMSDTTRFVEVPITVTTPPSTAAKDNGMRYAAGDPPVRRAHVLTRGATSATRGVFGMTAEHVAASAPSLATRARSPPPAASTRSTSGEIAPVAIAAPASTYSAAIVTGADDPSPDRAVS